MIDHIKRLVTGLAVLSPIAFMLYLMVKYDAFAACLAAIGLASIILILAYIIGSLTLEEL